MYQLGNIELPRPKKITRVFDETSVEHLLIFGKTTKRVQNRKEKFLLEYQFLDKATVDGILAEFELKMVRDFRVIEPNLNVGPTPVLVDIGNREYPEKNAEYLENFILILTEVH